MSKHNCNITIPIPNLYLNRFPFMNYTEICNYIINKLVPDKNYMMIGIDQMKNGFKIHLKEL